MLTGILERVADPNLTTVFRSASHAAADLGSVEVGSEHVLLGLLATEDVAARRVTFVHRAVTTAAVSEAVRRSSDDQPYLSSLGIDVAGLPLPVSVPPPPPSRTPQDSVEFRAAVMSSSRKKGAHTRAGHLPRSHRFSTVDVWLAVLEPSTRASSILRSLDVSPDDVRHVVLATLVHDDADIHEWPHEVPDSWWRHLTGARRRCGGRA